MSHSGQLHTPGKRDPSWIQGFESLHLRKNFCDTISQMIIQLTISQLAIVSIFIAALQFLLSNWIRIRLEKLISHEYERKLEDYRFSIVQREQAAKIATLFSKWAQYKGKEKDYLNEKELLEYYGEITKISYELSLWITDEDLVIEVMDRLILKKGAPTTKEVLIKIREHILGKKNKKINADNIVHWPK